jgi:alanine racemase
MLNTTRVVIDLNALRHNYQQIKSIAPHSKALAVIKSDAYGHGLLRIAQALPEADGFAMVQVEDLQQLRAHGIHAPALLMEGVFSPEEVQQASALNATVALCNPAQLELLRKARLQRPLDIWLKVNIGMNRFGFAPNAVESVLAQLETLGTLRVRGLMTHFPSADDLESDLDTPWRRFHEVVQRTGLPYTAANSAATLRDARTHGTMVRTGSILYGNNPFTQAMPPGYNFRQVMQLEASVIAVSSLKRGDALGYGGTFTAEHDMQIGLVGCGYGDGYPYSAPTGTPVLVNGQRSRTLGKVAMNVLAVDLSHLPAAQPGDRVTLWGGALPISEVAESCGMVSESLECGLTKRLPVTVIGASLSEPHYA